MMATYFHGGSDMQPGDNLQTLYLMNPNYVAAYTAEAHNNSHPSQPPPTNMLLLNHSAGLGGPGSLPGPQPQPGHQQFIGIPLAGPHSDNPGRPSPSSSMHHHHQIPGSLHGMAVSRVHYNLWSPTIDPSQTHHGPGQIPTAVVAGGAQGLSLSLSPHQQQNNNNNNNNPAGMGGADDGRMSVTVVGGSSSVSNGVQGVILGSKYLKAAQELLDEVVNVGSYSSKAVNNTTNHCESSGPHKDKAKAASNSKEPAAIDGSSGGAGESSGGGKKAAEQITAAQRQELQMKKAKLLSMLDEVEQRYRQYHTQMQVVVSSFEQVAGIGSAKSYTSLALQTISRQFRCLKDAIMSQIKATSKTLGEEDTTTNMGGSKLDQAGGGVGSRLRYVDHQLRQQRALQQLGVMQHNAWRPQRGLPERAVSVLRAWLFEHFLHPYPKDSDKHMLAKQTGLTRSQVSNWFINARVRLWKPMVEEMYVEEMKAQEQNGGNTENNNDENTNTNTNTNNGGSSIGNEPNRDRSASKATGASQQQQQQRQHEQQNAGGGGGGGLIQAHQQGDHHTTNDMISNLSAMSTTSMSSQGFTLIGSSSEMECLMARSPKKQRSMQSSPSSILSMDMEMKPPDHHHHHPHHPQTRENLQRQQTHPMIIGANHHQGGGGGGGGGGGFNPYIVNDMGRFNPDQLIAAHQYHGNNGVSLTLGLPHCENQSLSLSGSHQQNFISNQGMQLGGRRLDIGGEDQGNDFCGISMGMGQPSHPNTAYESIDIQSRKRFAAHQLLHDFVA